MPTKKDKQRKQPTAGGSVDSSDTTQVCDNMAATELTQVMNTLKEVSKDIASLKESMKNVELWIEQKDKFEEEIKERCDQSDVKIANLEMEIDSLKTQVLSIASDHKHLKEYTLKLETQSRRDNLLLSGIPETPGETDSDCYEKVCDILEYNMNIHEARQMRIV